MFVLHNVGLKNYFAVISFSLLEQINEGVAQVKGVEQTIHNFNKKFNLRSYDTSLRLTSDFKFEEYKTYIENSYNKYDLPASYYPRDSNKDYRIVVWLGNEWLNHRTNYRIVTIQWLEEACRATVFENPIELQKKYNFIWNFGSNHNRRKLHYGLQLGARQDTQINDKIEYEIYETGYSIKGFPYKEKQELSWEYKWKSSKSWKQKKIKKQYMKNL